ncbi:FHA domain-containing protein [Acidovorax sp. sic0104]|uniref:FHA domain-containing protein n=1 Tax=Acidovorax sp. sic0104 TaxID=2854784 RepID=UPI001C448073|nr:FHA domain-containing protein [Acidovorax sp. sic0104]MBV7542790.1 FHA domain-containing protein [Acidovorax sp. sic0104]
MMPTLGLIEAFDRHGALLARAPVTRWPVTVGRGLDCDLVLDDPFVAPTHLRIDRAGDAPFGVQVEVLNTRNGARLHRKHHREGERFDWPEGTQIDLGRTHIALRLADTPIAQEQALPAFPWRTVGATAALVALMVTAAAGSSWLEARDASQYLKALPGVLLMLLLVLGAWSGMWAAVNKVFAGQLQFWRHVRIACAAALGVDAVHLAAHLTAYAFSLEVFAQFANVLSALVLAGALYAHLATVLPRRRVGLAWMAAAAVVLGVPAWLGAQWLNNMRLSPTLYMSSLFPPSLRVAPAVPVEQFLQETESLRGKLERRLSDDGQGNDDE